MREIGPKKGQGRPRPNARAIPHRSPANGAARALCSRLTGELSAHVEPMARWIIGRAVERLPTDDRDRFREEWFAHLDETPGTLRKLWHAVGCHLGAGKVADPLAKRPPHDAG
jgi:hypothetical protein